MPRYFTLKWLLISAPEFALLAPVGLFSLAARFRRGRIVWGDARIAAGGLLAISVVVPLWLTLISGVIQFDSIRHVLLILPPLAVLLAVGLVAALAEPIATRLKAGLAVAGLGLAALATFDMVRLHPYQYVYFNRSIAGGLRAAAERYETDYLGLSYREGVRWVLEHYEPKREGRTRIAACRGFHPNLLDGLELDPGRAAGFEPVQFFSDPQLVVAFTRQHCDKQVQGKVLATVEREGTTLLYVIETAPGP